MKKIYVKPIFPIDSLASVIECLYRYSNGRLREEANKTYSDEDCTVQECHPANRSFEDLLVVARTYFPFTTEEELMSALIEEKIEMMHCDGIRKIVFCREASPITPSQILRRTCLPFIRGTYRPKTLAEICERVINNHE